MIGGMIKAALMIAFFLAAAAGLMLAVEDNLSSGLVASPAAAPPAAASVALAGTIDYYPDNTGRPVPYLVYAPQRAAALFFDGASACVTPRGTYACALIAGALGAYYPGRVRAEGRLVAASLVVSRLSPP
jgi:hypothetical protein